MSLPPLGLRVNWLAYSFPRVPCWVGKVPWLASNLSCSLHLCAVSHWHAALLKCCWGPPSGSSQSLPWQKVPSSWQVPAHGLKLLPQRDLCAYSPWLPHSTEAIFLYLFYVKPLDLWVYAGEIRGLESEVQGFIAGLCPFTADTSVVMSGYSAYLLGHHTDDTLLSEHCSMNAGVLPGRTALA